MIPDAVLFTGSPCADRNESAFYLARDCWAYPEVVWAATEAEGFRALGVEPPDGGIPDDGTPDAGAPDAGMNDAGANDASTADAGVPQADPPPSAWSCNASGAPSSGAAWTWLVSVAAALGLVKKRKRCARAAAARNLRGHSSLLET